MSINRSINTILVRDVISLGHCEMRNLDVFNVLRSMLGYFKMSAISMRIRYEYTTPALNGVK